MRKILITGISGFAGSHLAEYLISQNSSEVFGTYLTSATHKNLNQVQESITLTKVDLMDYEEVEKLIGNIRPDFIFHLAAFPSPAQSFKNPSLFLTNNIVCQLNLLEAIKLNNLKHCRILIVSSAEEYGLVMPEDLPIDELTPLRPVSPYSVSKIAQDFLGLQYFLAFGLQVIRVRPFAHIGPRLSPDFAASAFSKKIAEIEAGKHEPVLTVGNLSSKRDLTDVRDMVRGYDLLLKKGIPGEVYNIGRGESVRTGDLLEQLLSMAKNEIKIRIDDSLLRPNDIPELRCDNTKFINLTGWEPEIPLKKSLEDTLNYWRATII